ncbi:MAG: RIP metalloprotease RseP [Steroidobacterales bacterium]
MTFSFLEHLLAFVAAICLLVTVHEFGHYWVARRLGFKVLRFSVGFGKALWTRVSGPDRTEYVIAAIPLGGYVKMLDEREGPVAPQELSRAFTRRPHWQRIAVLLAGPAFNIIFAVVVLTAMFAVNGANGVRAIVGKVEPQSIIGRADVHEGDEITAVNGRAASDKSDVLLGMLDAVSSRNTIELSLRSPGGNARMAVLRLPDAGERRRLTEPTALQSGLGLRFYEPPMPAVLGAVEPQGPAGRAGLQAGDEIRAIDGVPVTDFMDLVARIQSHPGDSIAIGYRRNGVEATVRVPVLAEPHDGRTIGRIHVSQPRSVPYPPGMVRHSALSLPAAFARANVEAWNLSALQARLVWRMVIGQVSIKNLSGPLSIAEYAGDSASLGVSAFLSFLVLVSLALGFMNLLPIPILDGGQIVFQALEWLKGSPLSERFQAVSQQLGIALLVLLMCVALFNDLTRQLG